MSSFQEDSFYERNIKTALKMLINNNGHQNKFECSEHIRKLLRDYSIDEKVNLALIRPSNIETFEGDSSLSLDEVHILDCLLMICLKNVKEKNIKTHNYSEYCMFLMQEKPGFINQIF